MKAMTPSAMYIIKEGKVKVTLTNEEGKELILTTLKQGDNFGELSLLDDNTEVSKCDHLGTMRIHCFA